jgi:recombination protein RecT
MSNEKTTAVANPSANSKEITQQVLSKIQSFQTTGELKLPVDYSPENALKSAYLMLIEQKVQNKPVLEHCTKESVANALLDMVVQGLSPMKKQCYFIPYGDKLQLSRSYMGTIAVAKRIGGVKSINAQVIYIGDSFAFAVDPETGIKSITKHETKFENIDDNKIAGAYAVVILEDGTKHVEIMTIAQIERSWMQGAAKGNSGAHTGFKGEMSKKTVINRALKLFINSSDDASLFQEEEINDSQVDAAVKQEIKNNANKTEIGHTEEQDAVVLPSVTNLDEEEQEQKDPALSTDSTEKTKTPVLQF